MYTGYVFIYNDIINNIIFLHQINFDYNIFESFEDSNHYEANHNIKNTWFFFYYMKTIYSILSKLEHGALKKIDSNISN